MSESKSTAAERVHVLVTTEYRGVFAGEIDPAEEAARTLTLHGARCAIYWGTTGGFLELAEKGPGSKAKIGARADQVVLHGVTSVTRMTDGAAAAWARA